MLRPFGAPHKKFAIIIGKSHMICYPYSYYSNFSSAFQSMANSPAGPHGDPVPPRVVHPLRLEPEHTHHHKMEGKPAAEH